MIYMVSPKLTNQIVEYTSTYRKFNISIATLMEIEGCPRHSYENKTKGKRPKRGTALDSTCTKVFPKSAAISGT